MSKYPIRGMSYASLKAIGMGDAQKFFETYDLDDVILYMSERGVELTPPLLEQFKKFRSWELSFSHQMVAGILGRPNDMGSKHIKVEKIEKGGTINCWYFYNFLKYFDLFPLEKWSDLEWKTRAYPIGDEEREFIINLYKIFEKIPDKVYTWKVDNCRLDSIEKEIKKLELARAEADD